MGELDKRDTYPMSRVVSRWEELQSDFDQARALAIVETPRIGRRRALERLAHFIRRERAWFQRTNTRYVIRTVDPDGDD